MTLIFVMPNIFSDSAAMSREPVQVISAMTAASPIRGDRNPAIREIEPWYRKMAAAENITPMPREEAKTMELMPSSTALAFKVS